MKRFLALAACIVATAGPLSSQPWEPITAMAILDDAGALVTGGLRGEVLWRELKTGEVRHRWAIPDRGPVVGLHSDSSGTGVVATWIDQSSAILTLPHTDPTFPRAPDQQSLQEVQRWRRDGPTMSGVRAERGGKVATGFPDGTIRIQSGDGTDGREWKAHTAAVTGLVWSNDGSLLYSCSFDGGVSVWVARSGERKSQL